MFNTTCQLLAGVTLLALIEIDFAIALKYLACNDESKADAETGENAPNEL